MFSYLLQFFLLFYIILHIQPLSASVCFGAFKRIYSGLYVLQHVKKVKRITGLTDEEIRGAVILDVGSYFTYNFAEYARIKMGARDTLAVNVLTEKLPKVDYPLYDIPEHRLLRMYPLSAPPQEVSSEVALFEPAEIKKKLRGTFADITISLSVVGRFNRADTKLWLEQLTKVTKPQGIIIIDFGQHGQRNRFQQLSVSDFERILLQMRGQGVITEYKAQHKNRRFAVNRFIDPRFPNTSITYRIINGSQLGLIEE